MRRSTNQAKGTTSGTLCGQSSLARSARQGRSQPEVWFRVVHIGLHGQNSVSEEDRPAYREQTVEITLGPKGAFSNGNVGALTRQVKADQVVNAVPQQNRKPKTKPPKEARTPKVVELLRKAIEWQALIESGEASNQAAIARQEGITRARVTQVMGLLRLEPEIQKHIQSMAAMRRRGRDITERALRPIAQMGNAADQVARFREIIAQAE